MNIMMLFFALLAIATNDNKEQSSVDFKNLITTLSTISTELSNNSYDLEQPNSYWELDADDYGFQPYNGFGSYDDYLKFKGGSGYGHDVYDPSHREPNGESYNYDQYIAYQEEEEGIVENPIYNGRYGPEEELESFDPETYNGW